MARKLFPTFVTSGDDVFCELLVLWLAVKCKLVGRLSVGHLVDLEPFHGRLKEAWHNLVDVLDVVEILGKRIVDINGHHFPVSLTLVDHRKHTKHLHFENGAPWMDGSTDLTDVNWVVVPLAVGRGVGV